ncbi:MAG: acylneuraminate cytidylyltransferase family protein [Deltaproteobacteria bacterium]|nr:acylneuraminate cytidylyltransferase family protein [Deltaproteobacteria bacterium]
MEKKPQVVALIPARSGSKRVPGKNIRFLAGHPIIAYAIAAARESGVFSTVVVSTDLEEYARIARHYSAEVPFLRPVELAGDLSPDIEWVEYTLRRLKDEGRTFDCFSILRPTSPFRKADTIRRAWREFRAGNGVDSLRAVEKCAQHPGKMWIVSGRRMTPLLPQPPGQPWHSSQYQSLPEVYVQNASLEIALTRVVFDGRTIAGNIVMPFFTQGHEGLDVNRPVDWQLAEELVKENPQHLPSVSRQPWAAPSSP